MLPRVDLFAIGFLLGLALGIACTAVLAAREASNRDRDRTVGLRHHPAFKDWRPQG